MSKPRLRIAVVDDEVSVRKALQRLLQSAEMDADMFPSGAAFLLALQNLAPDCVVLDLNMPEMNGFDVQERMAQRGMRVPMIVITGNGTEESRVRAIAGGADLYLLKPFDDRVLLDGIVRAVARHRR